MEMFFLFLRLAYEGTVHVKLGHDSKRMPMSAVMHANIKGHKTYVLFGVEGWAVPG
jgi:hypothetical protein